MADIENSPMVNDSIRAKGKLAGKNINSQNR
jgi:hypothetical protein